MVEEEKQEEDIKLNKDLKGWHDPASPARAATVPPSPLLPPRKRGATASREERESGTPPSPNTKPPPSRDWQGLVVPDQTRGGAPQRRGGAGDPWALCPRVRRGRSKGSSPPEPVKALGKNCPAPVEDNAPGLKPGGGRTVPGPSRDRCWPGR
ncbi:hypothetical protein Sjap_001678 [Stephania japonica]|uniref:Uncharacterized protein n=1 Tax=Stephania japonica TaxID=461633 RepID=A0AAP0KKD6_9MAGN